MAKATATAAPTATAAHLIAIPEGDHIVAVPDRRNDPADKGGRRKQKPVEVVLTGDAAPMPRATAKELKAAKQKAEAASRINEQTQAHMDAVSRETPPAPAPVQAPAPAAVEDEAAAKLLANMQQGEAAQAPAIPTTGYQGPMRSLRERLKQGAYKKAPNGQPCCGDEVATALGSLEPAEVVKALMIAMALTVNPYAHLNVGQQSMNLRNKLRGQMKRGELGGGVLREAVEEVLEARPAKPADQTPAPAPVEAAPAAQAEPTPAPTEAPTPAPTKAPRKPRSPRQAQGK